MGISNNGIGIRSGTKNISNGNLATQAVIPPNIKTLIQTASPGSVLSAGVAGTVGSIIIDKELVDAAKKKPESIYSIPGNGLATTINPSIRPVSNPAKKGKERILEELYFKPDSLLLPQNTFANQEFDTSAIKGFATQRPEIISLMDFKSIFQDQENLKFNNLGFFFDYKFQLIELRKQTIKNLESLFESKPTIKTEYSRVKVTYNTFINEEERKLKLIETLLTIFESIDKAFQPKEINKEYYKVNGLLNLEEFFTRKMNYRLESFNSFSDTKILYQLLFDLRSASEAYSINLLGLQDNDRVTDVNSVKIDTTYTRKNGFTFDINSMSTRLNGGKPKLGVREDNFFTFINSLPTDSGDRAKLLFHIFGRILRVSKGLNKPNVKNLLSRVYSTSTDFNPFDNVLGTMPLDIFTQPLGTNTIASSLLLSDQTNPAIKILPFENTIVDDGETQYIPGSIYFRNSLLRDLNSFSFISYGEDFSTKTTNTVSFYNEVFDFYNTSNKLIPKFLIKQVFQVLKNTINSSTSLPGSAETLLIPAIFALANTDKVLKLYLFQYLLLLGMSRVSATSNPELYSALKKELGSTNVLSAVDILLDLTVTTDQSSNIKLAATVLAQKIGTYITEYLTQNSILQINTDSTYAPPARTDGLNSFFLSNPALITRTLADAVNSTTSNRPNLLKDFIDLSLVFFENAKPFTVNEQSTLSSYLNISLTYLLLTLYEGFCSLVNKFISIKFDIDNGKMFGILFDSKSLKASNKALEKMISEIPVKNLTTLSNIISTNTNSSTNQQIIIPLGESLTFADPEYIRKFDSYYQNYSQIVSALQDEDVFIQNIISTFSAISLNFNLVKQSVNNLFTGFNSQDRSFINQNQGMINKTQFKISKQILKEAKESLFTQDNLKENEYYHLLSYNNLLKGSDKQNKVFSIGIPNGFIDSLRGRLNKLSAITGEEQVVDYKVENTLVVLNIFRHSLLDEEVIFKPQKFLFDLNIGVETYDEDIEFDPYENFNELSKNVMLIDNTLLQSKELTKQEFFNLERYKKLSQADKEQLLFNIISSNILSNHVYLSTGFNQTERSFPVKSYSYEQTQQFIILLNLYLSINGIQPVQTLNELLQNPSIKNQIKDSAILLQKTINSTNTNLVDSMIFTPKVFDKIFNLSLNTKDFVVDIEATPQRVLEFEDVIKRLKTVNGKTMLENKNDATMDEFYVAIEVIE